MKKTKAKPFYKSKTFWINILGIVVVVATSLKEYLSTAEAVSILAIINIILRAVTTQPIKIK